MSNKNPSLSGNTVKINTSEEIGAGYTPGLKDTIKAMDEFDMNVINDVGGSHDFNGAKTLGGKK